MKSFFFFSGCLKSGKSSALVGDLFFDLTCATCSVEDSESCTRQNLSWLVFLNNPLSATDKDGRDGVNKGEVQREVKKFGRDMLG